MINGTGTWWMVFALTGQLCIWVWWCTPRSGMERVWAATRWQDRKLNNQIFFYSDNWGFLRTREELVAAEQMDELQTGKKGIRNNFYESNS